MMAFFDPDYNKLKALKLIRRSEGLSRAELAEALGVTKTSVTGLAGDLLQRNLIVEDHIVMRGRGRPRTALQINAEAGFALSLFPVLDGPNSIDIVDLKGRRISSHSVDLGGLDSLETLPARICDALEEALRTSPVPREAIRCVGVGLPALLDQHQGIVHWLPGHPAHSPIPLAQMIEDRFGIAASIDSRTATLARAEHWFGHDSQVDSFTVIALLDLGINGARYREGQIQTGHNGMSVEFGHIKIALPGGRACSCGGSGCLTAYVGGNGILTSLFAKRGLSLPPASERGQAFREVVQEAGAGVPDACEVFRAAGEVLGFAIASHIHEHDPGRIIITTSNPGVPHLIEQPVTTILASECLPPLLERTRVEFRTATGNDYWKGTAALALEHIYRERRSAVHS